MPGTDGEFWESAIASGAAGLISPCCPRRELRELEGVGTFVSL